MKNLYWGGSIAAVAAFVATTVVEGAGFFVCPAPCEAKYLPRDMETLEDCLCNDGSVLHDNHNANMIFQKGRNTLFRCPENSAATRLHPISFNDCTCLNGFIRDDIHKQCTTTGRFECRGRYQPKKKAENHVTSLADCDCVIPYVKDEATGACVLKECPRAGNYIKKKSSTTVNSLVDCTCLDPYTKNDQSGECLVANQFTCPQFSKPSPNIRPRSFDDCHCDWGFIRTLDGRCVREGMSYMCPPNSGRRSDLPYDTFPKSFHDCECLQTGNYVRNDVKQSCDDVTPNENYEQHPTTSFECPRYSRQIAPIAHSIEQCECLAGYGLKVPELTCVRLSGYKCPVHSYKSVDKHVEENFDDCSCARGFHRDSENEKCLEYYLTNENGCPHAAFLMHWPLQSADNCKCTYGFNNTHHQDSQFWDCNHPDEIAVMECPGNSFLSTWPLTHTKDCTCAFGYQKVASTKNQPSQVECQEYSSQLFHHKKKCPRGAKPSQFDGECRFPVEEVRYEAFGSEEKATGELVFMGIEYDYVVVEKNIMVIQGDVAIGSLLPRLSHDRLDEEEEEKEQGAKHEAHILHGYYNAERDHRWKDATICYEFDRSARAFQEDVLGAMDHISRHTGFQFRQCGRRGAENSCEKDSSCHDYVSFTETRSSCWSYIGRIGGKQSLGISDECGVGNLIHVLLHAVGLHHAIDRPDRDDHVRIAWECIPESKRSYFIVEQDMSVQFDEEGGHVNFASAVPYDFHSIMHHPSDAFVHSHETNLRRSKRARKNHIQSKEKPSWCRSVFPLVANGEEREKVLSDMGQREKMAHTDVQYVWQLYPTLKDTVEIAPDDFDMHTSRLHERKDVFGGDYEEAVYTTSLSNHHHPSSSSNGYASRIGNAIGAFVTVCALFGLIGFALIELKKRSLRGKDLYYESLLTERNAFD